MISNEDQISNPKVNKPSRKEQILESLATILEESPGSRITTAGLARHVGVSEAALYRHFPSKAKMYDALIEFIESTLFSRISQIWRKIKHQKRDVSEFSDYYRLSRRKIQESVEL